MSQIMPQSEEPPLSIILRILAVIMVLIFTYFGLHDLPQGTEDIKKELQKELPKCYVNYLAPESHVTNNLMVSGKSHKQEEEEVTQAKLALETRKVIARERIRTINGYTSGYCTSYVASKLPIPSGWGNAKAWPANAEADGYAVNEQPTPGSVIVTSESRYGHVGVVEKVTDNYIEISEMNYSAFGVVSSRVIDLGSSVIKGFIHL
jgi:surface antigen